MEVWVYVISDPTVLTSTWRIIPTALKHPLSSVQSLSHVQLFAIPWTEARQASLSITNSHCLLKLTSMESALLIGKDPKGSGL